ncbi:hydantoinase/oxoprolinase family protein [Chelativorans sp. Marseille-P2723]|uniref:ROK family protein n=1 Tax=Chelativorans sp. Marseille-P2723 TaxID=2709133 RepID=UPI00156E21B8|nr:hydantoinase/oxoprolinase family protein [Chelativorans sp. Marseille-P2723]
MQHQALAPLLLGIDTGGTYTDAVLYDEQRGIVAKAKALTTRHDLAEGMAEAVKTLLGESDADAGRIGLVSMSTTLATNALVEGQGGRSGLVMVGFSEADLDRAGLRQALGSDPVVFIPGGHDGHGNEKELDLSPLFRWLETVAPTVSAFAVCAYFAVRNPAHEIAVCEAIQEHTGLPVTASHELSARLGGPRRALTTLLNARLISLIDRLITSTSSFLERRGIAAPLMVVRGDGALISAPVARTRPIETILSGPAASLVGARHLTGIEEAIVSDIGGTTTDIAILSGGRPRLDEEGALVGGWRTMVEAVAMRTFGLGGDSEVSIDERVLEPEIQLGPRRLVPLSLAEMQHPGSVIPVLERQLCREQPPGRLDGRFVISTGLPERFAAGLSGNEERIYRRLKARPQPLDEFASSNLALVAIERLVSRGLAQLCGFTPSDAAHVAGQQAIWNGRAAHLGAMLFARRSDKRGRPLAADAAEISARVLRALTRRSAEAILETALAEDGLGEAVSPRHPLISRALDRREGVARFSICLDRPVIGLGASARVHYSSLDRLLESDCVLPNCLDVANAVGAVAGQVRIAVEAKITQPQEGLFRVSVGSGTDDFDDEEEALVHAERQARALAAAKAAEAGAVEAETLVERAIEAAQVEGRRLFVEGMIRATASGRPRIAATGN